MNILKTLNTEKVAMILGGTFGIMSFVYPLYCIWMGMA